VPAGSSTRSVSHVLARIVERYTKSESPSCLGYRSRKYCCIGSNIRPYASNVRVAKASNSAAGGVPSSSGGTVRRQWPPGLSSYRMYRVDCSR
jgi:hypothetical protein